MGSEPSDNGDDAVEQLKEPESDCSSVFDCCDAENTFSEDTCTVQSDGINDVKQNSKGLPFMYQLQNGRDQSSRLWRCRKCAKMNPESLTKCEFCSDSDSNLER